MADIDDKFHHHAFLPGVLEEDQRHILKKDVSYGASWKKRGGVGAFMMLARKWDRLEEMLGVAQYNILDAIHVEGVGGEDGTVLAEVRDLRRYLALVEAEALSRAHSVIRVGDFVALRSDKEPRTYRRVVEFRGSLVVFGEGNSQAIYPGSDLIVDTRGRDLQFTNTTGPAYRPGTPEDGGHHASVTQPVLLTNKEYEDLGSDLIRQGSMIGAPWRKLYQLGAGQDGRPAMIDQYREEYGR